MQIFLPFLWNLVCVDNVCDIYVLLIFFLHTKYQELHLQQRWLSEAVCRFWKTQNAPTVEQSEHDASQKQKNSENFTVHHPVKHTLFAFDPGTIKNDTSASPVANRMKQVHSLFIWFEVFECGKFAFPHLLGVPCQPLGILTGVVVRGPPVHLCHNHDAEDISWRCWGEHLMDPPVIGVFLRIFVRDGPDTDVVASHIDQTRLEADPHCLN